MQHTAFINSDRPPLMAGLSFFFLKKNNLAGRKIHSNPYKGKSVFPDSHVVQPCSIGEITQSKAILSRLCLTRDKKALLPQPHDFRCISLRSQTCPVGCEYAVSTIGVLEVISRLIEPWYCCLTSPYRLCVPECLHLLTNDCFLHWSCKYLSAHRNCVGSPYYIDQRPATVFKVVPAFA